MNIILQLLVKLDQRLVLVRRVTYVLCRTPLAIHNKFLVLTFSSRFLSYIYCFVELIGSIFAFRGNVYLVSRDFPHQICRIMGFFLIYYEYDCSIDKLI